MAPATLVVNSVADNITNTSHLTLREAVSLVNNGGSPAYLGQSSMPAGWASQISGTFGDNDTIQFSSTLSGGTVKLDGTPLEISSSVTITGLGVDNLAISGQQQSAVILVNGGTRAQVAIADLTIEDGNEGGISNSYDALSLSNCTLVDNSGNEGGGISNSGTLTVTNCTFANNSATWPSEAFGGAIYNEGTLTATNCTFSGNSAADGGGGVATAGTATLNNTIVANSESGGDLDVLFGGRFAGTHDLIRDGSDLGDFADSLQGNPLLAPLSNYGGPTPTLALLPGSPAIDAGSKVFAVDVNGNPLTTDQRGEPRIIGSSVDIGAFESQGFTISVSSGSNQSAAYNTTFAEPLTVTVSAGNQIEPVNGGVVTFTVPPWAATATLSTSTATISGGSASVTATANDDSGPYTVTAFTAGAGTPASFHLANFSQGSSNFVVTDSGDDSQLSPGNNPADTNGGISLRSAIAAADFDAAHGISDTITFSPALNGATISLSQGQLELTAGAGMVTIEGVGQIAVSGDNENKVLQVDAGATADIAGITIEDGNSGTGGGILNSGTLTVSNSTLAGNVAGAGGGIANNAGATLTLINCSVAANSAGNGAGGGILNSGTLTTINCTVADNSAGEGGGIDNLAGGSATLNNTIVANSAAGGDLSGDAFSGSHDLIGDGSSLTSFSKSVQGNPLLTPLGNYGGPTQTMALLPGSSAIAAGGTALAVDGSGHPLSTDQRGQPRISGGTVDMGAYESNGLAGTSAGAVYSLSNGNLDNTHTNQIIATSVASFTQTSQGELCYLQDNGQLRFYGDDLPLASGVASSAIDSAGTVLYLGLNGVLNALTVPQPLDSGTPVVLFKMDGAGSAVVLDQNGNLIRYTPGSEASHLLNSTSRVVTFALDGTGAIVALDSNGNLTRYAAGSDTAEALDTNVSKFAIDGAGSIVALEGGTVVAAASSNLSSSKLPV